MLALVVLRRAQRRAVVEVGPAIPGAVPGVFLDRGAQLLGLSRQIGRPAVSPRASASVGEAAQTT